MYKERGSTKEMIVKTGPIKIAVSRTRGRFVKMLAMQQDFGS